MVSTVEYPKEEENFFTTIITEKVGRSLRCTDLELPKMGKYLLVASVLDNSGLWNKKENNQI